MRGMRVLTASFRLLLRNIAPIVRSRTNGMREGFRRIKQTKIAPAQPCEMGLVRSAEILMGVVTLKSGSILVCFYIIILFD